MSQADDQMAEEYPTELIVSGVRGKYYEKYIARTNVVRLAPDVAAVFKSSEQVNEALRKLIPDKSSPKAKTSSNV